MSHRKVLKQIDAIFMLFSRFTHIVYYKADCYENSRSRGFPAKCRAVCAPDARLVGNALPAKLKQRKAP